MNENKSFFSSLSPKALFIGGIVSALLVIFSIGFFVMLGLTFYGSSDGGVDGGKVVNSGNTAQIPNNNGSIRLAEITDSDWYKGNKNAEITIVEFSDTECPFCKRFHSTMNQIIADYGKNVKWVYKHAPLDSLHRKSRKEAEAVECAGELGGNDGFWKYLDRLMDITPSNDGLSPEELPKIAEYIGLNKGKFNECLSSGKYAQKVESQLQEAQTAGLRGTPYSVLIIDDQKIPISGAQPYSQVKSIIDSILK